MALPDLDALIGDIRREAARRRAAPDFPVDDEARLAADMDRHGPHGGLADLPAVLEALRALAGPPDRAAGTAGELADLVGSALRTLAVRLNELERRVDRVAPVLSAVAPLPGAGPRGGPGLEHWDGAVTEMAAGLQGRVLVAGPGAARLTGVLIDGGIDAYGVDPTLAGDDGAGPVRAGGVAAHVQTVGEEALALAVLTGPLAAAELPHLDRWAAALAVRARAVMVVSEAPWAWRLRVGEAGADTSAWRPVSPESWLTVLAAAGYRMGGSYGGDGRDYCLAGHGRTEARPGTGR